MNSDNSSQANGNNAISKSISGLIGAIFLLLAAPLILTGTSRYPAIGLTGGLLLGFLGVAPFISAEDISIMPLGLVITAVLMIVTSLLCIAGFICSFKPDMFTGRHGSDDAN